MEKIIETSVDKNNLVTLTINGDLLEDKMEDLENAIIEATRKIIEICNTTQKKAKVLVDLGNFNGKYAIDSFKKMVDFAMQTELYIEKSAVFGGQDKEKLAAEMVIDLAHRNDIKVFNTKEEALEWLK